MTKYTVEDLLTLMARLREPHYGCPWDQVQTYQTIAPSTLEEAYEVVDAIEKEDYQQLKEELGDFLFQVIFYSQLGAEDGKFTFDEIVSNLVDKLIRRHPHVFPEGTLSSRISSETTPEERAASEANIKASWEAIKKKEREEKGHTSILDDVPINFPALTRAAKLQKRASSIGFDWKHIDGVYDKIQEEIAELKQAQVAGNKCDIEDELGDVLFSVVNLSRHLKIDSETALRRASQKFEQRFRIVEDGAIAEGVDMSDLSEEQLDILWENAKNSLKSINKPS